MAEINADIGVYRASEGLDDLIDRVGNDFGIYVERPRFYYFPNNPNRGTFVVFYVHGWPNLKYPFIVEGIFGIPKSIVKSERALYHYLAHEFSENSDLFYNPSCLKELGVKFRLLDNRAIFNSQNGRNVFARLAYKLCHMILAPLAKPYNIYHEKFDSIAAEWVKANYNDAPLKIE